MKKRILFIINPDLGVGKQKIIEKLIPQHLNLQPTNEIYFEYEIAYTQHCMHAFEISRSAANNYDVVVAVGGDGTVNEVGRGLVYSKSAMAIIPTGSGNGFAQYFNIPENLAKAIKVINDFNVKTIDTVQINDTRFINVAGVGFDARISHLFAAEKKRGFWSYMKLILSRYFKYKSKKYTVYVDGKELKKNVFLITFANSSLYGNHAHIAPRAVIDDGLIDICFMRKFPFWEGPFLAIRMLMRTLDKSKYVEFMRGKEIVVKKKKEMKGHIDGEPVMFGKKIKISIDPLSLNVLVPKQK